MAYLILSLCLILLIFIAVGSLALFRLLRKPDSTTALPPTTEPIRLSILKPLKGVDESLEENLRSFFEAQTLSDHPIEFELLFSIESEQDPAYPLVQKLMAEYSTVQSKLFFSKRSWVFYRDLGANPKLKNIARSYHDAHYDLVLISDSNVRLQANDLVDLYRSIQAKDVGMVTSIVAGVKDRGVGGYFESLYLNGFYARMMAFSNTFVKECVVGKSMMFRRSVAERFGGLKVLSQFLAEDFMASESVRKLGLKVATATQPVNQIIGDYRFMQFWNRHIRWGRIRKAHAPALYLIEPLSFPLVVGMAMAISLHALKWNLAWAAVVVLIWMILDFAQFTTLRRTLTRRDLVFPFLWLVRETLAIPLWICIASSDRIEWRGNELNVLPGGRLKS